MFVSKYKEEDKNRWLEGFKNSRKTAQAYAKEVGIPASTLRFWLKQEIDNKNTQLFGKIEILEDELMQEVKQEPIKYSGSKINIVLHGSTFVSSRKNMG